MKKLMIMAVAAMATGLAAVADTSFAYQGVLRDELGNVLNATQAKITFRLYDAATEGTQLWEKELNLSLDTNGLFNAELTGNGLADTIADAENQGKTIYVGLTVEGSAGEITPRQKMIPTPIASYAQNVAKANKDFTVEGNAYFKGAVSMQVSNTVFNAKSVSASESLDVAGVTTLRSGAEIQGNVKIGNSLTVNGVQMSMPIGAIIMWAGSKEDLPADGCWVICDGQTNYTFNGSTRQVPDLRGRFIVGVGTSADGTSYEVGATGGEEKHALSVDELAAHSHNMSVSAYQTDCDNGNWAYYPAKASPQKSPDSGDWKESSDNSTKTVSTQNTGSGTAHENRPPYYALCYIIKIK